MVSDSKNDRFTATGMLPNHPAHKHITTVGQPPAVLARVPLLSNELSTRTVDRLSNAECGMRNAELRPTPHSAIRNPNPESRLASRLCQLHAGIAPYAGVIVASALIVSVGLLYWLVLGPTSKSHDYPNNFWPNNFGQDEFGQDALGQFSLEWPSAESPTIESQPTGGAVTDGIVTDSAVEAWMQATKKSSQQREHTAAVSEAKLPNAPSPGPDLVPAGNRIEPQQDISPSENEIYPTTRYAPFDFAAKQSSDDVTDTRPIVAGRTDINQPHSVPR